MAGSSPMTVGPMTVGPMTVGPMTVGRGQGCSGTTMAATIRSRLGEPGHIGS